MLGLEQYEDDVNICCRCSCCKFIPMQKIEGYNYVNVCPSISRYEYHAYSGGGRMDIAAAALANGVTYNDRLKDIVYNCQSCGACGTSCNYAMDMQVQQPIEEFRIKCVEDGQTHPELDKVIQTLKKTGSMIPPKGKRGDWASGMNIKNATRETVEVLYHVGCLTSYDRNMHKLARATAKILQKAGVDFGIAGDSETCCGGRAYQMGYRQAFLDQARKNVDLIKKSGAKTVVVSCADGYHAFKVLYDQHGLKNDIEVLHITEYIDRLIKEGKLTFEKRIDMTVTYHDPCRLGRMGEPWVHWEGKKIPGGQHIFDPPKTYRRGTHGVYEPPRDILKNIPGIKLNEMVRIKEYAWCCGAGGGVIDSNPEYAEWTAGDRIREAVSSGAKAIVTACPWCEKLFLETIGKGDMKLKVYDILELVEQAL